MKLIRTLILVVAIGLLVGCGSNPVEDTTTEESVQEKLTEDETIKDEIVDDNENGEVLSAEKNLFSVEVTLPASLFEDSSQKEIEKSAKESDIGEVIFNDNGSVTYKMSKSKYKELLASMKTSIDEAITEMLNDKESYPSFTEITYNDDCTEFTIKCDRSKYTEMDTLYAMNFYFQGWYYQAFNGVSEEDLKVVVNFIDKDTDEILNTADSSQIEQ